MGRTLPTIVQTFEAERELWGRYRRALRKEDQEAFDALWRHARRQAAPAAMASRPLPLEAFFLSMLVGVARELLDVEKKVAALEEGRDERNAERDEERSGGRG